MSSRRPTNRPAVVPVAVPAASTPQPDRALVSQAMEPLREMTRSDLSLPVAARPSRVSRRALTVIRDRLSARDWAVLQTIADHRFVTTAQLQAFHFTDHTTDDSAARVCRRVLARLRRDRLIAGLARRVGGIRAGSASRVWYLDCAGDRLLRTPSTPRRRAYEPSLYFLQHTLAVVDTHLRLVALAQRGRLTLVQVQTEPQCHRHYRGLSGAGLVLKPDLFVVTASATYEDRWFIEVDQGTESRRRLLAKCQEYEAYRRSGIEQGRHQVFPLVIWLIADGSRRDALRDAIARDPQLRADLFRLVTPAAISQLVTAGA